MNVDGLRHEDCTRRDLVDAVHRNQLLTTLGGQPHDIRVVTLTHYGHPGRATVLLRTACSAAGRRSRPRAGGRGRRPPGAPVANPLAPPRPPAGGGGGLPTTAQHKGGGRGGAPGRLGARGANVFGAGGG